jgi:uncharacterized damage-inducible protein DinB
MSEVALSLENQALLASLDEQRHHILGAIEGIDDASLRRPVLPSGWSCLGLVNHLALDVERFWFRAVIAGEQEVIDEQAGAPNAWHVGPDMTTASVLDLYRQETMLANEIIANASMDAAPAWWPQDLFGDWRVDTVRQVVLHVMTETATHAGHLDAARELIDGKLWLVLTD